MAKMSIRPGFGQKMKPTVFGETAASIGSRLCADAVWLDDLCYWIGGSLSYEGSQWQVVHRPVGPNLYSGAAGIALFLAELFRCAPDQAFRKTAEGAMCYSISQLDRMKSAANFGFYSGFTGLAYVLHEMAESFGEQEFAEQSMEILRNLPLLPIDSRRWDIISGSAGVIPVLLRLNCRYGHQFLMDSAVLHGEALLQSAERGEHGWSWATSDSQTRYNLTGFSHGAAGVAWALLELYHKTGAQRFLTGAQEAFRYERHWYAPERENWPDFRSISEEEPNYVAGWCHGAPGIGLSRVRAFQLSGDPECLAETQAAVRTTTKVLKRALSGQDNYSLCHGHFGNAELLLRVAAVLEDETRIELVYEIATDAVEKYGIGKKPWPCGLMNAGETPDLLLGLAGIGYFYMRLHDPQKTPSVLLVGPD